MSPDDTAADPAGSADRTGSGAPQTVGVGDYRALLARRQEADGGLDPAAVGHAELVFNLTRLHTRLSRDFDALHRDRGWTWAGFRLMNVLWALGSTESRELARLSGTSRAAVSSALNTLERDGLVARSRASADRRLVRVELTERGRVELRAGVADQAERERRWFGGLDPADRARLSELLAALADGEPSRRAQTEQ